VKKRLFVAIRCDQGIENEIAPILKKLRINADQKELDIRWTPPGNFHVTLVFLGETPAANIPALEEKIRGVAARHAPFNLKASGLGAFPDDFNSRVIWVGMQNSRALRGLQQDLYQEIFKQENAEYLPHLTIGRLRNPHKTRDLLSPFVRKSIGKVKVTEMILYESLLKQPFPIYRPLSTFALTGADTSETEAE
jgi:2'-5' RNA ligase